MAGAVQQVGDTTFETTVLNSETPVLVDFFATWCGPCKAIAPSLEQLSAEYGGKVKFVKLDTDEAPAIMERFGIEGVPTLILFKGGKEVDRQVGAAPKPHLKRWIDGAIGGGAAG
jgi:thioredoxin 1